MRFSIRDGAGARTAALVGCLAALAGCRTDYVEMSRELGREDVPDMRPPIVEKQRTYYDRDVERPRMETSYRIHPGGRKTRHGAELAWYADGALQWEREFVEGEPAGRWRSWYPDGTLESETWPDPGDGEAHESSWWYPSGRLSSRGETVRGVRHGSWTAWYEDGTRRWEGRFVGGHREGPFTYWHADGSVEARGQYRADVRVGEWLSAQPGERTEPGERAGTEGALERPPAQAGGG